MNSVSSVVKKQFVNQVQFSEDAGQGDGSTPKVTWKRPGHMQYVESMKNGDPYGENWGPQSAGLSRVESRITFAGRNSQKSGAIVNSYRKVNRKLTSQNF